MSGYIKICGVTRLDDARTAVDSGANAIGLNLWSGSLRRVALKAACEIADAVRHEVAVVAVTVDAAPEDLARILSELGPHYLQLHGDEPEEVLRRFAPRAFKAVGLASEPDVELALKAPGELVLVDAKDPVQKGGTGRLAPFRLAAEVARARRVLLAGGLAPENVGEAIATVRPFGVDVASGVERSPGVKDAGLIKRFIGAARSAFELLQ